MTVISAQGNSMDPETMQDQQTLEDQRTPQDQQAPNDEALKDQQALIAELGTSQEATDAPAGVSGGAGTVAELVVCLGGEAALCGAQLEALATEPYPHRPLHQ